jgi:hypothetical protein
LGILRDEASQAYQNLQQAVAKGVSASGLSRCAREYAGAVSRYRAAIQELIADEKIPSERHLCADLRWIADARRYDIPANKSAI